MNSKGRRIGMATAATLALLFLLTLSATTAGANGATVSVELAAQDVTVGNPFSVDINITDVAYMGMDQVIVHFDQTAMQATAIVEGDWLKNWPGGGGTLAITDINNTAGTASFTYALMTQGVGATGSGTLATINFDTTAEGLNYPLSLTDVALADGNGDPITVDDVQNGTVNITAPAGPLLCTNPDPPSHDFGDVPEGQIRTWPFDITNCGASGTTLTWGVGDDRGWITETPPSGSTTTETDTATVRVDTTGLSLGPHTGTVTVTSNDGTKTGTISVNVTAPAPPAAVPGLSGIGMVALIGALAIVLAICVSAMRRKRN